MPAITNPVAQEISYRLCCLQPDEPANGVDQALLEAVTDAYYEWADRIASVMIANRFGDASVDDFWRKPESLFVHVLAGNGVSFVGDYYPGTIENSICVQANAIAKAVAKEYRLYLEFNLYVSNETLYHMGAFGK